MCVFLKRIHAKLDGKVRELDALFRYEPDIRALTYNRFLNQRNDIS